MFLIVLPEARPVPRKWVLVVDDDARIRAVWTEALTSAGYAVVGSEDGMSALELIRDLFPDLILLDLNMPRLSGWGFLDTVRDHPHWSRIPILIVSAYLDDPDRPITEAGLNIVGRLEKPVRLTRLIAKVRETVGPGPPAPNGPRRGPP